MTPGFVAGFALGGLLGAMAVAIAIHHRKLGKCIEFGCDEDAEYRLTPDGFWRSCHTHVAKVQADLWNAEADARRPRAAWREAP